ncbi:MAG: recombination mediator RecR [Acidobacteriota bacterium]|nr:recombination mediator RecR [Acidobacteriota bacterium]MDQ7088398.1 recombination mediator RecR [Acidobacteriota bacterium]
MSPWPEPLERLIGLLTRLPGIGPRSAQRLAFHLARAEVGEVRALAAAIEALPGSLRHCSICGHLADSATCGICRDARRDQGVICVVEQPDNVIAIERSGAFHGLYHVLGGAISPLRSIGPEDLRIEALLSRLAEGEVGEVILATNPTVEGEATALYIARRLEGRDLTVTRPATGLPVGGELDYVDRSTLARALEGRQAL